MDISGLDELPRAYRLGLSLRALGADDQLIAECLAIDVTSVGPLLDIAVRKLEYLQHTHRRPSSRPKRTTPLSSKGRGET